MATKTYRLTPAFDRGTDPIQSFRGPHRYFSNFQESPFWFDGYMWSTVEHAYQAYKAVPGSYEFHEIRETELPGQAKRLGRAVAVVDIDAWDELKFPLMNQLVLLKFLSSPKLAMELLSTGRRYLEEGNNHGDQIWGTVDGYGDNYLGQALMMARETLRSLS